MRSGASRSGSSGKKNGFFRHIFCTVRFFAYLCTAKASPCGVGDSGKGPFVYRLGRKIFILERAVRFCYGLHEGCRNDRRIRIGGGQAAKPARERGGPANGTRRKEGRPTGIIHYRSGPRVHPQAATAVAGIKIEVKNKHTTNYGKP